MKNRRKKREVINVTGILPDDGSLSDILGEDYELWMPLYVGGVPRNIGANVQDVDELALELSVKLWDVRLNQFGLCHQRMAEHYVEWWREKDPQNADAPITEITPEGLVEVVTVTTWLWVSAEWMSFTAVRPAEEEWTRAQFVELMRRYCYSTPEEEEKLLRAIMERADTNLKARAPTE